MPVCYRREGARVVWAVEACKRCTCLVLAMRRPPCGEPTVS